MISKIRALFQKHTFSTGKDLEQQNMLLAVMNEAAARLLSDTGSPEKAIVDSMQLLAESVDTDRMYILKHRTLDGKQKYEQLYEWIRDSQKGGIRRAENGDGASRMDSLPKWNECFFAGKYINSPLSAFSPKEREILAPFGIRSVLAVPVFIQDKLWGIAVFDDLRNERYFSHIEVSILHSGSLLLASTIVQNANRLMLDTRMRQQELMSDISRSFISREPLSNLINEALKQIGTFTGVARIVVATHHRESGKNHLSYMWCCSKEWEPKFAEPPFDDLVNAAFPASVSGSGFIPAICCNDTASGFNGKYNALHQAGIKSFIWTPVYVEGVFWGLISAEDCEAARTWSDSDIQLMGSVSSAIAGAMARDSIDKARAAALEDAVQASRAKSNFLAHMSHEMRTPMNAIIGMTAIGKNSGDLEKKDYAFEKIDSASSHLLGVINDILDMSKIEANKLELSFVTFSFEKMLQKVVDVINFRVEERQQEFTVTIDERIPRYLVGDDQRLAQVITNLISNAVKFTAEHGSIRLNAGLTAEENGFCSVQIDVSDSGIGISEEQQAKLFTSFAQAESGTARKFGGTGLGLAISKRIVEMMGGSIWLTSEPGKGSTFSFTFKAERGYGAYTGTLSPGVNINTIRILAVDDSLEILTYFRELMSRFGIMCDTAPSAEEALALIQAKGKYDLYFVDYSLPGMDGIELTRIIKAAEGGTSKVIMISSTDWSFLEQKASEAGVDKYLAKPLFPSPLADTINECLGFTSTKTAAEPGGARTERFDGFTMLLVEDVEINREIVAAMLEPTAITIEVAENGKEAVEKFTAAPDTYNLIFMDIQMPEMDGLEATRRIRAFEAERLLEHAKANAPENTQHAPLLSERPETNVLEFAKQTPRLSESSKKNALENTQHSPPLSERPETNVLEFAKQTPRLSESVKRIPIIAMTANVFREDVEKCLASGMDDHVGKPISENEVLGKLRKHLLRT